MYLSTDYVLDGADYRIANRIHRSNLMVDSSYTDTVSAFIPSQYLGNYILIISTDDENREYEYNKENNNTAASIITVSQSPPADLLVNQVSTSDSLTSGETIKVVWKVVNGGSNPATGYMQDNVYLSKDQLVDASDKLIGTSSYYVSLAPSNSRLDSISVPVSGVALGDYYVVVGTDIRNNINESNDTNNVGSSGVVNINIPEIFLNTVKNDNLPDNVGKYYRLYIHDSLIGESLLLTLDGDSANGNNELYIRRGDVPSRSEFDYGYNSPFAGDQEIVIPEIDSGTYYILVYGDNTAGTSQAIELLAIKMKFEIRKVTPSSGGNTGEVTLKIEGSKFDENTVFYLGHAGINSKTTDTLGLRYQYSGSSNETDTFLLVDPTTAFVVFDLTNAAKDTFDVIAEKNDSLSTSLDDGFVVVDGLPADIQLDVTRPSNARTNRVVSFLVSFSNNGNTDIVNGTLEVLSNGSTPISLTVAGLSDNKTSLEIPLEESDGIKGRLRPNGYGSVKVYSKASSTLGFSIVLPK